MGTGRGLLLFIACGVGACDGQVDLGGVPPTDGGVGNEASPGDRDATSSSSGSGAGSSSAHDSGSGSGPDSSSSSGSGSGSGSSGGGEAGVCTPGATRCSGSGVATCGENGEWGAPWSCATGTCTGAACAGATTMATSCAASGPGMTDCGASRESCCTSLEVPGGTYYRTYTNSGAGPTGEADPATVQPSGATRPT